MKSESQFNLGSMFLLNLYISHIFRPFKIMQPLFYMFFALFITFGRNKLCLHLSMLIFLYFHRFVGDFLVLIHSVGMGFH